MPFAAALSNRPSLKSAIDETSQSIVNALGGQRPDLACVFISHHYAARFDEVAEKLQATLGAKVLIGCTGERSWVTPPNAKTSPHSLSGVPFCPVRS